MADCVVVLSMRVSVIQGHVVLSVGDFFVVFDHDTGALCIAGGTGVVTVGQHLLGKAQTLNRGAIDQLSLVETLEDGLVYHRTPAACPSPLITI